MSERRAATAKTRKEAAERPIADNRQAGHEYHLLEMFEAGLVLVGTEVKAMREGRVQLRDAYCRLQGSEAYLLNAHVGQYSHGGYASHEATRPRKLLLRHEELNKLIGKTTEKGLTIVPLRLFFKNGRAKLTIALAKGKKLYDKRETIKRREIDRETRAAIKSRRV
jgi:SsrA-binding protein